MHQLPVQSYSEVFGLGAEGQVFVVEVIHLINFYNKKQILCFRNVQRGGICRVRIFAQEEWTLEWILPVVRPAKNVL